MTETMSDVEYNVLQFVSWRVQQGQFTLDDVCRYYGYQDSTKRQMVDYCLLKHIQDGTIERSTRKWGVYRKCENELVEMDLANADESPVDIWLPFGLSSGYVQIFPTNVIIVAGSPDAGKTALIMNIIRNNFDKWDVRLFDSESDAGELKKRLNKFPDLSIGQWKMKVYERAGDFSDVIFPGPGVLNIIDFLEIHDDFYVIGKELKKIRDKLKGAVAVVGLQKNPNAKTGLGGYRMLEVCRLALALDPGMPHNTCRIMKAKNRLTERSLNGLVCKFNLVDGCKFIPANKIGYKWERVLDEDS